MSATPISASKHQSTKTRSSASSRSTQKTRGRRGHKLKAASISSKTKSSGQERRDAMPDQDMPTLTPTTRRISKAKKGKRVHSCDQCTKVYTRAEHLRRHQFNHNSQALYRCEVDRCGSEFFRQDLLNRHMKRHTFKDGSSDLEDNSASPATTDFQLFSPTNSVTRPTFPSYQPHNEAFQFPSAALGRRASDQMHVPNAAGTVSSLPVPSMATAYPLVADLGTRTMERSPLTSASSSQSCSSESFPPPLGVVPYCSDPRTRSSSNLSVPDPWFQSTKSPVTSFAPSATWATPGVTAASGPGLMGGMENALYSSFALPGQTPISQDRYVTSPAVARSPFLEGAGDHFCELRNLMVGPIGMSMDQDGWCAKIMGQKDVYLEYYWQRFDPLMPVVHRSSFDSKSSSPLLIATMAAIGALYAGSFEAKTVAMDVHRRCKSSIQARVPIHHRSATSDIQATLLIELFGTFRGSKMDVELSSSFKNLYSSLLNDHRRRVTRLSDGLLAYQNRSNSLDMYEQWQRWVDLETKHRVFLGAFILDAQQAAFFGHEACHQPQYFGVQNIVLNCSPALWESPGAAEWSMSCQTQETIENPPVEDATYRILSEDSRTQTAESSPFQLAVILAFAINPQATGSLAQFDEQLRYFLQTRPALSSSLLITCNSLQMMRCIPLRDLLAVTGESWLLGRKLESAVEYSQARERLRNWTTNSPHAIKALWHAGHILRHAFHASTSTGVMWDTLGTALHESWCIYTAALVCWTFGAVTSLSSPSSSSLPPPPLGSSLLSATAEEKNDMWHYLTTLDTRSWEGLAGMSPSALGSTNPLMICVREVTRDSMSALLRDAEEVLTRLIDGRVAIHS